MGPGLVRVCLSIFSLDPAFFLSGVDPDSAVWDLKKGQKRLKSGSEEQGLAQEGPRLLWDPMNF